MKKLTVKLLVVAFALTCFVSTVNIQQVSAADIQQISEYGWKSGAYIGGHAGYDTVDTENNDVDLDGFAGGIHGGYNIVNGSVLYGIEADVSYLDAEQTESGCAVIEDLERLCVKATLGLNYLASVRGRIGVVLSDTTLIYATGGVAFTELEVEVTATDGITTLAGSEEFSETGYVIGGGAEMKITENMTVRAEVLHYGFEFEELNNAEADMTVARGGITLLLN